MGLMEHHLSQLKRAKHQVEAQPPAIASNATPKLNKLARLYPKELRKLFRKYFNHPFDAILKGQNGQWSTRSKPLDPEQIWELWRSVSAVIGLGFGEWTRYAVIDIDAGGRYHNEESLRDIREALEEVGINYTILIQSSSSGGWHLWISFERPLKSFAVACLLTETLNRWGFDIEPGHLEVNPNRKGWSKAGTIYNRVRLPLQSDTGAAILDDDLAPYSQDIAVFLRFMEQAAIANDADLVEELGMSAQDRYRELKKNKTGRNYRGAFVPGSARKWFKEQDEAIAIGQTGHGQSMILLRYIAAKGRVQLGLSGQDLADYIYQTMVSNPGYEKWCGHKKEMSAWAVRWARSAERHLYPYTGKAKPSDPLNPPGPSNEARKADAITRIKAAVAELKEANQLPEMKTARLTAIAKLAHCSVATLYKYPDLWANDADVAVSLAQSGITHDTQNVVVALSSVLSSTTQTSTSPKPQETNTATSCTTPGARQKTKTTQTYTQQGIEPFSGQKTVPITRRLAIVKNHQTQSERQLQPSEQSKVVPIAVGREEAWTNLPPFRVGDLVVEVTRPGVLLRLESIDDDGEFCRCRDVTWGGQELCLLKELRQAAIAK